MYAATAIGIIVAIALALIRAARGPTVFDRILAVNSMGTLTVILIAVFGFLTGRPEWLDLAILYALINFVGTLAVLKFSKYGQMAGHDDDSSNELFPWS